MGPLAAQARTTGWGCGCWACIIAIGYQYSLSMQGSVAARQGPHKPRSRPASTTAESRRVWGAMAAWQLSTCTVVAGGGRATCMCRGMIYKIQKCKQTARCNQSNRELPRASQAAPGRPALQHHLSKSSAGAAAVAAPCFRRLSPSVAVAEARGAHLRKLSTVSQWATAPVCPAQPPVLLKLS